jgi:uncharacterized membrane protein YfcA
MDLPEVFLLLAAGLAAGCVNAVAGGGSLITFPALLAAGLPPVSATVTNSLSVFPGYVASVVGSQADLPERRALWRLLPTAALGAAAGSAALLLTPARAFDFVVPFLVLAASAILGLQGALRRLIGQPRALTGGAAGLRVQVAVAVGALYGGYFNAALGVILVAGLALVLAETLNRINAIKNLLSATIGLVAVVVFAIFGPVDWLAVAVLAPATIIGGHTGARIARRVPARVLRAVIVVFGTAVGAVLLYRALTGEAG